MNINYKLLILFPILLAACSDESSTEPRSEPVLLDDWQVVDVQLDDGAGAKKVLGALDRIVEFGQSHVRIDESKVWVINQRGLGFRRELLSDYVHDGEQIQVGESIYATELGRETLVLESANARIEMRRDDDIPDPESWIEEYEALVTRKTTNNSTGDLAWDGEDLWISGGPEGKPIYRQDSDTFTAFLCEFDNALPNAIEYFKDFLWGNDGTSNAVHLYDHVNESISSPIFSAGRMIRFLAGERNFLWCASARDKLLRVYDTGEDDILFGLAYGEGVELSGGSIFDGRLFIAADGNLAMFDLLYNNGKPSSLVPRGAIELPGFQIRGVAHDGEMLWVNAQENGTTDMWLHRIQPPVGGGL